MTVSSDVARVGYAGDGAAANFAVPFYFLDADDLTVILRRADGGETVWVRGTQYTVAGAGDPAGGSIAVPTAPIDHRPQSGETLVILRAVPLTQETDYTEGDPLPAATLERDFDKARMVDQQLGEALGRALTFTQGSPSSGITMPEPAADHVVKWSAAGDALENWAGVPQIAAVAGVAGDIGALGPIAADITAAVGIAAAVTTAAAAATEITTVAGLAASVSTVAGMAGDIATVLADAADIGAVAGVSIAVSAVAGMAADIAVVAADGADIGIVAGMSGEVSAVAGAAAAVGTVAGVAGAVSTVAGMTADIAAVAADGADIGAVAGGLAAVSTVAGMTADIAAVAADAADIGTVAGRIAEVNRFAAVYQGGAAPAPTTRADGGALQAGDLYFDMSTEDMHVFDGAAWHPAYVPGDSFVLRDRRVATGAGLTGGGDLTADRTLAVDAGTAAGQIVQLDGSARLPPVDASQLTGLASMPTGGVLWFAADTPPPGFLKCNGAALSRTVYAGLFSIIGFAFGESGGNFHLPDLRGEFLRGWDDGRGVDAARSFATAQAAEMASHGHTASIVPSGAHSHFYGRGWPAAEHHGGAVPDGRYMLDETTWDGVHTHEITIDPTGGAETRPRNVALLACIKY